MSRQALFAWAALLTLAAAAGESRAETRSGSFHAKALGREVSYVVELPPSYESAPSRRFPVVYLLHGLFEGAGFWHRRGLGSVAEGLRESGVLPELLFVAVDGGNSFFVDGRSGRYREMVTRDLVAHVEARYRVLSGRAGRALLGVSMGGYAALAIAFTEPELFAAVATHSAMLLERAPSAEQGAGRWQMAAFHAVFGDPIDPDLWSANDPLASARTIDAGRVPALYFDCGAQDRYGLADGHRRLDQVLAERKVPHTFELPPGDHGYAFVRARLETSLAFLGRALAAAASAAD